MGTAPAERLGALDRLRSLVILLVVWHHAIIPYATASTVFWWVQDRGGVTAFDVALLLDDTFLMPTLFFVAG
jgi:peptidoglycan/LPS O-acetylase OafA/YrhL